MTNDAADRLRYYWTEAGMIKTFGPDFELALREAAAQERERILDRERVASVMLRLSGTARRMMTAHEAADMFIAAIIAEPDHD